MRSQENYWLRKAPPTPEVHDLSPGVFAGDEQAWSRLSPGYRRAIWRDAIQREATARRLSPDTLSRLSIATIDGGLGSLDEYLRAFDREDAKRQSAVEDVARLKRADAMHHQNEVQIAARERL